MNIEEHKDRALHDLINIIHFTETVSAKIIGLPNKPDIYSTVMKKFAQSKRYTAGILLLTDDISKLKIADTSISPLMLKAGEKASGHRMKEYTIDSNQSHIFYQVVKVGETIHTHISEVMGELFPQPLARLIAKTMGYEKESVILTPLKLYGEIIGVFAMSSTILAEHLIPSVRNLAQHISTALELADENAERKRAEEELKNSEERLRILFEFAPDAYYLNDLKGNFIDGNKAAEEIIGYKKEELIGKNFLKLDLLPPGQISKAAWHLTRNALGRPTGPDEFVLNRKDGSQVTLEIRTFPVKTKGQVLVLGIARDITKRKKIEEQLQQSQLLISLGEMTAGIAHEVNNPLGSVLLYSEMLMASDIPAPIKKDLRVIHGEAKRAANVMTDLLTYCRRVKSHVHSVNLHKILNKVLGMRRYQQGVQNITVHANFADNPLYVKGDSSQLMQAFMNLMLNAEEAINKSSRGNIIITTQINEEWAKVSIADDGTGIPEGNLSQVFYPFFTTKQVGEGTGLGLSTCYGIITAHAGLIRTENNDMGGATFIVELPLVEGSGSKKFIQKTKRKSLVVSRR
jgi:PAS domain S-box-containing protein